MAKIPLYVSNGHAYVWTVEDVRDLRSKHRICGTLSGTLPNATQQNFFLGLPLLLMPEEVVLLLEEGIAVMIDDTTATREPSASELQEWDESRKILVAEQIEQWQRREAAKQALEKTDRKGKGRISEEALQKRKERLERRAREEAAMKGDKDLVIPEPSLESVPQPQANYAVQIPPTSLSYSWYQPCRYDTLASAKQAGIWQFPSTPKERASCHIFRDLWEKGHFLGSGIKFGGEFLVYPGDPLRYHSHFVASVLSSLSSDIRPMEIVAHGRLATATKKSHLLCGWDEETRKVTYFSLEWSGFG